MLVYDLLVEPVHLLLSRYSDLLSVAVLLNLL